MNYSDMKSGVILSDYLEEKLRKGLVRTSNLSSENFNFNRTFDGIDYGPLLEENVTKGSHSDLPLLVQVAWTTVFGVMMVTATGGNCIVIWIVMAHRRMRTVTNYFLVNLSTADLLLTLFNCSFNSIYMIQRNWPFGTWYCTVSNFIAYATVAASVFTLTGISCDRYLAIVHPLHPRMSKASSLISIFFIWTASMIFAFPCLLYSATITHRHKGIERVGCILVWPDKKIVGSQYDLWYQMLFLVITYIVPMTLMSVCYTIMGKVLWGSRSIGELTQRQVESIRSKRKNGELRFFNGRVGPAASRNSAHQTIPVDLLLVSSKSAWRNGNIWDSLGLWVACSPLASFWLVVKMFILVVMIFGLCWLPYHSYFIYVYYDTTVIYSKYTQHVYLSFYWFAMSNAMVNPLIYYWMNARFRQYFKTAVCGWRRHLCKKSLSANVPPIARHSQNSKSGGDLLEKQLRSPHLYKNGNAHYPLLAGTNGIGRDQIGRISTRATRTTSLKKETNKKTTYL